MEEEHSSPKNLDSPASERETQPGKLLISEDEIDDVRDSNTPENGAEGTEITPSLTKLADTLQSSGVKSEITERLNAPVLEFDLPAGKDSRRIRVGEHLAADLIGFDFSGWRSLQRYNGIWHPAKRTIEVLIQSGRFARTEAYALKSLMNSDAGPVDDKDSPEIKLESLPSNARIRLGESSPLATSLLGRTSPRNIGSGRTFFSLTLSGIKIETTEAADKLIEQVSDSLFFDLQVSHGVTLSLRRLQTRNSVIIRRDRERKPVAFPRNRYQHEPVSLFNAGRDPSNTPLIRYWAFYQVLEFHFPKYEKEALIKQLSRLLKSPSFDPHREEHVLEAARLAANMGRQSREEDQLILTLEAITTAAEIAEIVQAIEIEEHLKDKRSELTSAIVRISDSDGVISALAKRIYDIRCKIVHSKSGSLRDTSPGLIPGSHHDDLVFSELVLMEHLAQQAIIASAERLHIDT